MKRSIFIAFIILAAVVGWIGSGQFSNNVVAQDDDTETSTETETSYSCLLYTSPSPRDLSTSRMPSSA